MAASARRLSCFVACCTLCLPFNSTAAFLMAAPAPLALPGGQGWAHGWAALPWELMEAVAERLAGRER